MSQPRIAPVLAEFRVHFEVERDGRTIRDHVAKIERFAGCRIVKTKRIREATRS